MHRSSRHCLFFSLWCLLSLVPSLLLPYLVLDDLMNALKLCPLGPCGGSDLPKTRFCLLRIVLCRASLHDRLDFLGLPELTGPVVKFDYLSSYGGKVRRSSSDKRDFFSRAAPCSPPAGLTARNRMTVPYSHQEIGALSSSTTLFLTRRVRYLFDYSLLRRWGSKESIICYKWADQGFSSVWKAIIT